MPFFISSHPLLGAPAGANSLSPVKVKQINEINKGYQECTRLVVKNFKSGKIKLPDVSVGMASCKVQYPAAAAYLECKRRIITEKIKAKLDVEEFAPCRKFLAAATFDESESTAFHVVEDQAFLGGIGLNQDVKLNELNPPNFSCDRLKLAETRLQEATYMLFGNFPGVFGAGEPYQRPYLKKIARSLGSAKKGAKYIDIPGFARLFAEPKPSGGKGQVAYFPTGACDFNARLGNTYAGLSIFYLIDKPAVSLTPYFGVSYYKANQKSISVKELVATTQRRLGEGFKVFKKNPTTYFVATAPFVEVDSEGDPRNICKLPRSHKFVAVIHTFDDKQDRPEYLILANVKNLCDYGDRLARRLGS